MNTYVPSEFSIFLKLSQNQISWKLQNAQPRHQVAPLHLIRIFAEIQFHINNQNIPNITRQKDLSKEKRCQNVLILTPN